MYVQYMCLYLSLSLLFSVALVLVVNHTPDPCRFIV